MASSSSYSQSLPVSSSSPSCNYDVFLSFRGEDTRKTFVDHLYKALKDRQIHVYKDDEALPRGESIAPALFKAIEGSQIAVVIFSKNYANSSWCLEELTHIMKCQNERNLIVMTIFFGVDPSDVRKQKRTFEEAFIKHEIESNDKVESWRKALFDASNFAGWDPQTIENGHESKAINKIADEISDNLFSLTSDVDEGFVGMRLRLQEVEEHLQIGSGGVRMVGIWGLGGGGKTTLANSLCMKISNRFEGYCIVDNIHEEASKHGLKFMQEKMLSRFSKTKMDLQSIEEGMFSIRKRLRRSNVLIILDDVDHIDQLEALAGSNSWFGSGSRIVITTRNEQLLIAHQVHTVYPVKLLTDEEAIQLFNNKAYNEKVVVQDYETLSSSVVSYADGLPLALKVLGSFLNGQEEKVWRDTLDRLKNTSELEIVEKLKISYDGLQNDEKELFLDIACFFRGSSSIKTTDGGYAMEMLEACGYHLDRGIQVLKQKALITIDEYDCFDMHDLLQEMAYYVVRWEHPNNPEKHSRVWNHEEIMNLYLGDSIMENDKIEVIHTYHTIKIHPRYYSRFVSKMKKLRWLKVSQYRRHEDEDFEGPDFLSNELRFIDWHCYSASPFPDSFEAKKLVVLKLHGSLQKELWKGCKRLPHLKVLHLRCMKNLVKTPHFNELPCLQKLTLDMCVELEEIHPSIGNHRSLEYIKVSYCLKLSKFPPIIKMEKLTTFIIMGYNDQYSEFPEINSNMESLETLRLMNTRIDALLSSIGERCSNLRSLCLENCFYLKTREVSFEGLKHLKVFILRALKYLTMTQYNYRFGVEKFYGLQHPIWPRAVFPQMASNLQELRLSECGLRDGEIPSVVGEFSNLRELYLERNDFTRLHFSLLKLTRLKYLNLSHCENLIELPELPSGIVRLEADHCTSLTNIGDIHRDCKCLCQVSLMYGGTKTDGGKLLLESMVQGNSIDQDYPMFLRVKGLDIAKGFLPPLHRGGEYKLNVGENWCNDFCGFLICTVVGDDHSETPGINIYSNKQEVNGADDVVWEESNDDKVTFVWYIPFDALCEADWWDESLKEVQFSYVDTPKSGWCANGLGVRMVAMKSGSGLTETLTATQQQQSESSPYLHQLRVYNNFHDGISHGILDGVVIRLGL